MATIRTLSVALLLALCFAACACAPAKMQPTTTSRYISYYAGGHSGTPPPPGWRKGCSAITRCPGRWPLFLRSPPKAGATTAAAAGSQSQGLAALPTDKQAAAPTKGGAKTLAATGSKGGYISRGALSRDKLYGRFGCPNPNRP